MICSYLCVLMRPLLRSGLTIVTDTDRGHLVVYDWLS